MMKLAMIGSRGLTVRDPSGYVPQEVTEIVSGGAVGIDQCAKAYAQAHGLAYTEFLPDYARYGQAAPLRRNERIVDYADAVLAFWDGESGGTRFVIDLCKKRGKPVQIVYKLR